MAPAIPGSLSEGAGSPQGLTEGVSSDGSSMPKICTKTLIGSEIFECLRSSGDTPSVSFADSSLREGAGVGCVPFNVPPGNRNVAGDFHRPYGTQSVLHFTIQLPLVSDAEVILGGALTYGNQLKA